MPLLWSRMVMAEAEPGQHGVQGAVGLRTAPQQWFVADVPSLSCRDMQGRRPSALASSSFKGWALHCVYGGGNLSLIEQHRRCPSTQSCVQGSSSAAWGLSCAVQRCLQTHPEQQMGLGLWLGAGQGCQALCCASHGSGTELPLAPAGSADRQPPPNYFLLLQR